MENPNVAQVKRAYYRDYYKRNRERIRENQRRYWQRKAEKAADSIPRTAKKGGENSV